MDNNGSNGTATFKSIVIGIAGLFLFIVAILLDLQYLYLMATALWVLPLASFLLAYRLAARFSATRTHPTTIGEGRRFAVTLSVTAEGGLPQATVFVADGVPRGLVPAEGMLGGDVLAPLDTWDGAAGMRAYHVEADRRGVYDFAPARLQTTDPLGLFAFTARLPVVTQVVVHPEPLATREAGGGGEGAHGVRERDGKTRKGDGMDFHGVREYRPGDALRRVHWRTTARTGNLAVVEFERAYEQDLVIGLDLLRGSEYGQGRDTTLEYAVKVAATLTDRTLRTGGGVSLITQTGRAQVSGRESDPQAARFLLSDLLARARAEGDRSLAEVLHQAHGMGSADSGGTHWAILTARGDPRLSAFLSERVRHGDEVAVYFFEPASFGGPRVMSPAVAGGTLRVIECGVHSPWREGGRNLEYLLRSAGASAV